MSVPDRKQILWTGGMALCCAASLGDPLGAQTSPAMRVAGRTLHERAVAANANSRGEDTVDVIKGKVIGPDSAALKNALVTLTDAKTGVRVQGRTNERGEFRLLIKERSGDYELVILVIGLTRFQKRVIRTGPGEIDGGVAYM